MSQRTHPMRLAALLVLITAVLGPVASAQSSGNKGLAPKASVAKAVDDPEFARLVREWTTRPDFMSPLVDHLPKVAGVPSPKDVLGHYIGEPKKLTYYADILKYYRALAAATPRVKVITIG